MGYPFYVGLDYGILEDISVGIEGSYRSYDYRWINNDYNFSIIGIRVNANYHFNKPLNLPKEFDLYAGVNSGYYIWSIPSEFKEGIFSTGIEFGIQAGGRYFLTNKLAISLELGGILSLLEVE